MKAHVIWLQLFRIRSQGQAIGLPSDRASIGEPLIARVQPPVTGKEDRWRSQFQEGPQDAGPCR